MDKTTTVSGDDQLTQFVYASRAAVPFDHAVLMELLEKARRNNALLGVGGVLLYHQGSFLQVLEGPAQVVVALYAKIERDKRHDRIVLLNRRSVSERTFSEWSMGLMKTDSHSLKAVPGLHDFLVGGILNLSADSARITQLLDGFRAGRWRQNIV